MARPQTIQPTTAFGEWLRDEYERRGLTQTVLAERSGFRQSTINGYISGLRVPDREKIEIIARALSGSDADNHVYNALLNAGLKAAFPRPEDAPLTYPEQSPAAALVRETIEKIKAADGTDIELSETEWDSLLTQMERWLKFEVKDRAERKDK